MTGWLLAVVVLAPLAVLPAAWGVDHAQAKNAVMIWLGLAGLIGLVRDWWLRAFLAWACLGFLLSGMRWWGLAGLLGLLAWTVVYSASARSVASWRAIRYAIAGAALFQVAWMAMQAFGWDPVFAPVSYRGALLPGPPSPQGWFANPSDTALFLGLALPSVLMVSPWLGLLVALAIVTLRSSAGFFCVLVAAFWWVGRNRTQLAAMALVAPVVVWGFVRGWDPQGLASRWLVWQHAWYLGTLSPWIGWGVNSTGYRLQTILPGTNERWDYVFNDWLQAFVELGVPGVLIALGFVGSLVWRWRSRWRELGESVPALLALLGVSLISIPFHIGPVALLGAVHLGRLEAQDAP